MSTDFKPTRASQDLEMLNTWKKTGDKTHLHSLLKAYDPIIRQHVNKWISSGIPSSVLNAEAKLITTNAFAEYDPKFGTQLNTHVINRLQKLNRLGYKYQNVAKIPEHRIIKLRTFQHTKNLLNEKLGRDPTIDEMQDELHWKPKEIERLETEQRKALIASADTMQDMASDTQHSDEDIDKIHLLYHELAGTDKSILEYSTGLFGKPKLSGNDIAKKLRLTPTQVSRIKKTIAGKLLQY